MDEGLFEKAFREKKESFGLFNKPIVSNENKKVIQKPIKPQQQGTTVTNVNVGSGYGQGYTRPMQIPKRKTMPKKQEYIITKQQAEQGLLAAKTGAKAVGSGAKKVVGFLKGKRNKSPYKKSWFNK